MDEQIQLGFIWASYFRAEVLNLLVYTLQNNIEAPKELLFMWINLSLELFTILENKIEKLKIFFINLF